MASVGDSYLPDLARVFARQEAVFSWQRASLDLRRTRYTTQPIETLLSSSIASNIISQPVCILPEPSRQARSTFETKTAAINVTPTSSNSYDINQIKDDILWLSQELELSEEESLRTVLLEWEQRSKLRLLAGYSEAEIASLRDSLSAQEEDEASQRLDQLYPERSDTEFDTDQARRRRILAAYFHEQAGLLSASNEVLRVAFVDANRPAIVPSGIKHISQTLHQSVQSADSVDKILTAIESRLQSIEAGRSWSLADDEAINDHWVASELQSVSRILEGLLLRLQSTSEHISPSQTIIHWLRIASGCNFFSTLQPTPFFSIEQIERLQANTSFVSLSFLSPAAAIASLEDITLLNPGVYFLSSDIASEIHNIIFSAVEACTPQAAPAALGWVMILTELQIAGSKAKDLREEQRAIDQSPAVDTHGTRRNSYGSMQQSIYEDIIERIINESPVSEPVAYLLRCTLEADHALEIMASLASMNKNCWESIGNIQLDLLQELINVCISTLGYTSDLLATEFALLTAAMPSKNSLDPSYLAEAFIKSDFLMESIFDVAAARFPYESLPFLRLCKLLARANVFDEQGTQYVTYRLHAMRTFTQPASGPFASYQTIREDENLNLVELDIPANIVGKLQHTAITYGNEELSSMDIPAGTIGEVISESDTPVIKWQHSFSALALMGLWLELHYHGQLQSILSPFESSRDVVLEVIELLSTLLTSTLMETEGIRHEQSRKSLQDALFEGARANLNGDVDVIDLIFEIAEQELQSYRRRPSHTFDTGLLISCTDFMSVFIKVRPTQFWSFINKSSLLGLQGSDSILITIVSGVEAANQSYDFLESCSRLYKSVIEACLTPVRSSSSQARPTSRKSMYTQSLRVQASVLTSFTESLYAVFDTIPAWTFASAKQNVDIIKTLSESFRRTVLCAQSVGEVSSKLRACFTPSSDFLAEQSRPSREDTIGATSIIKNLLRLAESRTRKEGLLISEDLHLCFAPLLDLACVLVRLSRKSSTAVSSLEIQLFNASPLLIRIMCVESSSTTVVLNLIRDLIDNLAPTEAVSLLGHLGSASSLCLLNILEDQHIEGDMTLEVAAWQLLTKLVGRNQQWLALIILTGAPPEKSKRTKETSSKSSRGQIFMENVLNRLVKIAEMPQQLAVPMLEFLKEAQQNWSWTSSALQTNNDLWPSLVSFITDAYVDSSATLQLAYRNKIAALITELATAHLHHARVTHSNDHTKVFFSLLQWLAENAIEVQSYNLSLHANLRKNFVAKFAGLDTTDFKRTGLLEGDYGDHFYYDLGFADDILHAEQFWTHQGGSQDQSFSAEFHRANLNLSLVDSELLLLRSLQDFCIEHCGWITLQNKGQSGAADKTYHGVLVQIVQNCLRANTRDYPPQKIFENLFQLRADLAIVVLQQLVVVRVKGFEVKALLKSSWECATFRNGSYEKATANDDLTYWRSILTVVLLSLQFHVGGEWVPPVADHSNANLLRYTLNDQIPIALDIITVVVGQGLKSVVSTIQEQKFSGTIIDAPMAASKDVSLILTIFETILRMSRLTEFASEASDRLISSGAIQSCLLLYSWSHTQMKPQSDDESTYADSCLQFLAALSSLPPVTEEMAVEGLLSRLLNARMTQVLQNVPDGAGHLDKRSHCQTLYHLWATGILPICLNLLHSVGAPVAAEVSIFLSQFPKQLDRASTAFISGTQSKPSESSAITLTVANEAATIALVSFILSSYRNAGASAAIDPTRILSLPGYDEHKKALTEDLSDIVNLSISNLKASIVPTTEKEFSMAKAKENDSDKLTNKVLLQLRNALTCLKGQDIEGDDKQ